MSDPKPGQVWRRRSTGNLVTVVEVVTIRGKVYVGMTRPDQGSASRTAEFFHRNYELIEEAWEYGFYDSETGPDPIWWYTFGGLVGFETVEMAEHTASKSVWGQAVIVRRRKGSTDWEPAEP